MKTIKLFDEEINVLYATLKDTQSRIRQADPAAQNMDMCRLWLVLGDILYKLEEG